jgi:hypothetical protein
VDRPLGDHLCQLGWRRGMASSSIHPTSGSGRSAKLGLRRLPHPQVLRSPPSCEDAPDGSSRSTAARSSGLENIG